MPTPESSLDIDARPKAGVVTAHMTGYLHPAYAMSLSEFGRPLHLIESGSWLLERAIPGTPMVDGMGCYPLLCCQRWSGLRSDLEVLTERLVSVVAVSDPFGNYERSLLNTTFDTVKEFKQHFVVDLSRPPHEFVRRSHQRKATRALRRLDVRACAIPSEGLGEWLRLYSVLKRRHQISGIRAFSDGAFKRQFAIPGLVVFEAIDRGTTAAMDLWFVQGAVAYLHLSAASPSGYANYGSYALKWHALEYFRTIVEWLNLGADRGSEQDDQHGLAVFKKGWSTGTRTAYLCGRVLQHDAYEHLVSMTNSAGSRYMPPYRRGEFS